jgi:hypothetical protein
VCLGDPLASFPPIAKQSDNAGGEQEQCGGFGDRLSRGGLSYREFVRGPVKASRCGSKTERALPRQEVLPQD